MAARGKGQEPREQWLERIAENARIATDGRVYCRRHGKISYQTEREADRARNDAIRSGDYDPGLEIFRCPRIKGWHLGHADGWRSLGRLMEMAQQ